MSASTAISLPGALPRPGTAQSRRILVTLLATVAITLMGLGIVVPLMPVFAQDLGASGFWLGMIVASFSISRGILQPVVGVLSDRYGRKRFIVLGLGIYAAVSFVYIAARSPFDLTAMRFVHGAGSAMVIPIVTAYLGDITPPDKEGKYMAFLNMALFGGLGAGPLLGGVLFDTAGIETAFVLMGTFSALALGLVIWLLPGGKGYGESEELQALRHLRETLRSARVLGILSYRTMTALATAPTYTFLPVFMDDKLGASGSAVGLVITVRVLVNASTQLPGGYLADRYNRVALATIGALGTGAAVLLVPQMSTVGALVGIIAVMGVFEGLTWATLQAMAVTEGRAYGQGSVQGLFQMALSIGLLAGALGGGLLMDAAGLDSVFLIVGLIISGGALLAAVVYTSGAQAREPLPSHEGLP